MSAQAVALDPEYPNQKPKRTLAGDVFEAANKTLGAVNIVAAPKHIADAVVVVQNGISAGATKVAVVAGNHGYHGVAALSLK